MNGTGGWHFSLSTASLRNYWNQVRNKYLLQLLTPSVLADNLAVKHHRGREQTEHRWFPHAALHKRPQVRVQLHGGQIHFSLKPSGRDSPLKEVGTTRVILILPALTALVLMSNTVITHSQSDEGAPVASAPCCDFLPSLRSADELSASRQQHVEQWELTQPENWFFLKYSYSNQAPLTQEGSKGFDPATARIS